MQLLGGYLCKKPKLQSQLPAMPESGWLGTICSRFMFTLYHGQLLFATAKYGTIHPSIAKELVLPSRKCFTY